MTMNAARRARKKAQPDRRQHAHHNRKARTDSQGRVTPCPQCRPISVKGYADEVSRL